MIKVVGEQEKEFNTINEFYSWLMKNKTIEIKKIEGSKEAEDLYNFLKYYIRVKKECITQMDIINNSFLDKKDNDLVTYSVKELIRMNSDGKFVRACLIALGYDSFNNSGKYNKYLPLATAYETFQTSILIHDDIIDNASLRRGKITIPKMYEEEFDKYDKKDSFFEDKKNHIADSLGICIGDLGFYLTNKILIDNYKDEKCFGNLFSLYNDIVINTIKGEIIDVALPFNSEYKKDSITVEKDVMEIYKLKTAWYSIIGPYLLGMSLTDCKKEQLSSMEKVLYNLGIAFQIKDDILGIYGNEKEIGKSSSSDISEFKQTILYSYISENDKESLEELHKYYGKIDLTESDINRVKEIFEKSGSKEYAINKMNIMFKESRKLLDKIDFLSEEHKSILYGFISYLDLRTK